jgi:hypothetical protein|tara:strand:+ start:426 stop:611 length:186 start_codon:yes stop_codon:yes gene_type:complete
MRKTMIVISLLTAIFAGCVTDKANKRQQKISVNVYLRGIDVEKFEENPGTAEVNGSYSVTW